MDQEDKTESSAQRIFVIGDIHGCNDEPRVMLEHLEKKEHLHDEDVVVFLGDYIDRGPSSKEVVDLLLAFKQKHANSRFLRGNHEAMLADFLQGGNNLGFSFLRNGGVETIQSYGVQLADAAPDHFSSVLPPDHLDFFNNLETIVEFDQFICVHAGLNPRRTLDSQVDAETYWIRDEFISNPHPFGKLIVFGHTPWRDIFVNIPYKVGVDTGLVFGNKLTCLELREGKAFQVARKSRKVSASKIKLTT